MYRIYTPSYKKILPHLKRLTRGNELVPVLLFSDGDYQVLCLLTSGSGLDATDFGHIS